MSVRDGPAPPSPVRVEGFQIHHTLREEESCEPHRQEFQKFFPGCGLLGVRAHCARSASALISFAPDRGSSWPCATTFFQEAYSLAFLPSSSFFTNDE